MGERIKKENGNSRYFITVGAGTEEKEYEIPRDLFIYLHNKFEYYDKIETMLECLKEEGVDNWSGYERAMGDYHSRMGEY